MVPWQMAWGPDSSLSATLAQERISWSTPCLRSAPCPPRNTRGEPIVAAVSSPPPMEAPSKLTADGWCTSAWPSALSPGRWTWPMSNVLSSAQISFVMLGSWLTFANGDSSTRFLFGQFHFKQLGCPRCTSSLLGDRHMKNSWTSFLPSLRRRTRHRWPSTASSTTLKPCHGALAIQTYIENFAYLKRKERKKFEETI